MASVKRKLSGAEIKKAKKKKLLMEDASKCHKLTFFITSTPSSSSLSLPSYQNTQSDSNGNSQDPQSVSSPPRLASRDNSQDPQSASSPPRLASRDNSQDPQSASSPPRLASRDNSQDPQSVSSPPRLASKDNSQDPQSASGLPRSASKDNSQDPQSVSSPPRLASKDNSQDPQSVSSPHWSASKDNSQDPQCALDIANFICNPSIPNDEIKYKLIENRAPDSNFRFPNQRFKDRTKPSGIQNRCCQHKWFSIFKFLSYSRKTDQLFCLSCILFPTEPKHGKRANVLITQGLKNWRKAKNALEEHSVLEYHKTSEFLLKEFLRTYGNLSERIDIKFNDKAEELIKKNRAVLSSIIKTIEVCGRLGIALRQHRDDETCSSGAACDWKLGNFKALLNFRVDSGDTVLEEHLKSCAKNARYDSKTAQNELLQCMKRHIQSKIIFEIKNQAIGSKYSLIADEVTDVSNSEQMGIVLRYTKEHQSVERLVEYVDCESITGAALCTSLVDVINSLGLNIDDCRAQTYDGAGNMAGITNGCAANFSRLNTNAPYFHCINHDLNLALSKSSEIPEIICMLSTISQTALFFKYSPKRQRYLEKIIEEYNLASAHPISVEKVKLLCSTRWVERHTALFDFETLYTPLLQCFENIKSKSDSEMRWDAKSVTEANGLYCAITSSSFIVSFQCARYIFSYTSAAATMLQGRSIDVIQAYENMEDIISIFKEKRKTVDNIFHDLFTFRILSMSKLADIEISIPRRCSKQTLRNNMPCGDDVKTYWKTVIFIPYLDKIICQLSDRFSSFNIVGIMGLGLLPANLHRLTTENVENLSQRFYKDLPNGSKLEAEVELWKRFWKSRKLPDSISSTLDNMNQHQFPNIYTILSHLLLIPVSAASVERSNSSLKFVKNKCRSTMTEDRLNALMMLFIHKDIDLDIDEVITSFARSHTRRMMLQNPLGQ